jgi:hypothetical protein
MVFFITVRTTLHAYRNEENHTNRVVFLILTRNSSEPRSRHALVTIKGVGNKMTTGFHN